MRRTDIPDVGHAEIDRSLQELRRRRHAPSEHRQLTHSVRRIADDGRQRVRVDRWQRRDIAGGVGLDPKDLPDCGLAFGLRVQVAHARSAAQNGLSVKRQIHAARAANNRA